MIVVTVYRLVRDFIQDIYREGKLLSMEVQEHQRQLVALVDRLSHLHISRLIDFFELA